MLSLVTFVLALIAIFAARKRGLFAEALVAWRRMVAMLLDAGDRHGTQPR